MNDDCLFCKIIKKEIPSTKIYENEYVYAFKDISPMAKVHILVIPKIHIKDINELNEDNLIYLNNIFMAVKEIVVNEKIADTGYRVVSNCGDDGCQSVKHLHFHILGGEKLSDNMA